MDSRKKVELSERRRMSYANMDPTKKDELLKRRRMQYALARSSSQTTSSVSPALHQSTYEGGETSNSAFYQSVPSSASQLHNIPAMPASSSQRAINVCAQIDHSVYPRRRTGEHLHLHTLEALDGCAPPPSNGSSVLSHAPDCKYCLAKRFYCEPPFFCCSEGEVRLAPTTMPDDLLRLFISTEPDAVHFRRYVQTYNNHLALTTFRAKTDLQLMKNSMGIYTFSVQGKIYHRLPSLQPASDSPRNLQLYLYDGEAEIDQRMTLSSRMDHGMLRKLLDILRGNPYAVFLRQLKDLDNVANHKICLINNPKLDQRVFNKPTSQDVAAILTLDDESDSQPECHIQIYAKDAVPYKISHNFASFDALQYPMFFAKGEGGWHFGVEKLPPNLRKSIYKYNSTSLVAPQLSMSAQHLVKNEESALAHGSHKRNIVSCRQYYCYKLQMRDGDRSGLLHGGHLLQQYIVDMFVKVESCRLDYVRKQQKEIRTEFLQGLLDSISSGNASATSVGRKTILPPSFMGGPRDMRKRYLDAMALVQQFGKPDFFLTMTCNPAWKEITEHLLPRQLPDGLFLGYQSLPAVYRVKL